MLQFCWLITNAANRLFGSCVTRGSSSFFRIFFFRVWESDMLTGIFGEGEDGSNATGGWFSGCEGILKGEFREHTILSVTLIVFFFWKTRVLSFCF